jgi:hypothetical protein
MIQAGFKKLNTENFRLCKWYTYVCLTLLCWNASQKPLLVISLDVHSDISLCLDEYTHIGIYLLVQKLKKLELPYDPAILLLGMYLKECKTVYKNDISLPMLVNSTTIYNSQVMELAYMPINR